MGTSTEGLPSGNVTFVFTDIEGSTRVFVRLGDAYVGVLERHRQILHNAWAAHGGHEVSTEGDANFVAFADATAAVEACVDAQLGLSAEPWPERGEIRVRMGIHTGLARPYGSDYVALAVHQAARVVAAGNGGQILLSEQAAAHVESLSRARLRPLGRYRLRDFEFPPQLFMVDAPGMAVDLPAIRAVPAEGHNLVRQTNATVGREEMITRLARELQPGKLVTLVGPGGVGKSRVATDLGMSVATAWDDGVWKVDLAAIADLGLVAPAVAEAVGVPVGTSGDRAADLMGHFVGRRVLLILDNCEHMISACRALIEQWLGSGEAVGVLATSREPIRASGELMWPVTPLQVPTESAEQLAEVEAVAAVELFAERGAAVRPGFVVDEKNAPTIAAICRHLDGLPLALELAAANLSVQSPTEILSGLEDRFRLLRSRDRSVSGRHETMEGVLEWSYRQLGDAERVAFRRLALFGAGFDLGMAASAVGLNDADTAEVPQLVWSLVDRSLISAELAADATRYRMLETVQAYGRDRLEDGNETGQVAMAAANHLLEHFGPWHPADPAWVSGISVELDNLRALIPYLVDDHQQSAQQVACAIGRYHDAAFSYGAGIEELGRFAGELTEPSSVRASLLTILADLYLRTGDTAAATRLLEDADVLRSAYGTTRWDDVGVDRTRGEIARRLGKLDEAIEVAKLALQRDLSERGRSRMYNLWGTTAAAMGDLDTAQIALSKELELNLKTGYEGYVASARGNLAEVALRLGEVPTAAHHQRGCLQWAAAQGSQPLVAYSLIVAARVAGAEASWNTSARLHAKAEVMLSDVGLVLYEDDRRESDLMLADARAALGDEGFAVAFEEGEALETPESIDLADSVLGAAEERSTGDLREAWTADAGHEVSAERGEHDGGV